MSNMLTALYLLTAASQNYKIHIIAKYLKTVSQNEKLLLR